MRPIILETNPHTIQPADEKERVKDMETIWERNKALTRDIEKIISPPAGTRHPTNSKGHPPPYGTTVLPTVMFYTGQDQEQTHVMKQHDEHHELGQHSPEAETSTDTVLHPGNISHSGYKRQRDLTTMIQTTRRNTP